MASATQITNVEKGRSEDCFSMSKRNSLDSSLLLCSKKIKMDDASLISNRNTTSQQAIDERLSILQLLLPQGCKMEEDEVLRVLIEYVKELETEIKMFNSALADGYGKDHNGVEDSPLQRRGLCIVPLSSLAKAL